MQKMGLKKGSKVKVEPVRKQKDIKAISKLLQGKPRDLLLWFDCWKVYLQLNHI